MAVLTVNVYVPDDVNVQLLVDIASDANVHSRPLTALKILWSKWYRNLFVKLQVMKERRQSQGHQTPSVMSSLVSILKILLLPTFGCLWLEKSP